MEGLAEAISQTERVLGEQGRLSTAIEGFIPRAQQVELAGMIARVIYEKTQLVAEAGTGTGKTFSYLVPCLLSGKKAVLSTATKTLQDQLFQNDLPLLIKALGLSTRVQNLKGRANYICRYRVALHAEEGHFIPPQAMPDLLQVRDTLPQLIVGDRVELPDLSEDSPAWPYVTSTADNCLGSDCPSYHTCFLVQARKRALEAQIVVINHHVYFADSRLKEEGFGELLPGVEVVVFDEAHALADIAAHFQGVRVGTRQCREVVDDALREWPALQLATVPLKQLSVKLDVVIEAMRACLSTREERLSLEGVLRDNSFLKAWEELTALLNEVAACFPDDPMEPGLLRCKERLEALIKVLDSFLTPMPTSARWVDCFKQHLVFHATPFDVSKAFQTLLSRQTAAYIFTSATLTMAHSFDCFTGALGLETAETCLLPSPFDFERQALLYLPRTLPDPRDPSYHEALLARAVPLIKACGGRCFFLFTSHRALKQVALLLANQVHYPLLIQGDEAKSILLARFRSMGNAVLLGTATFWEGVDVKGEALSCVIIDKIPFASPADPVVQGKLAYLKSQGKSGFDVLSLPDAVLALKQGVGRLIRDATDKGVLMIADPRLTARPYGKRIFASLPPMRKTRDEKTVLRFIHLLELEAQ